MSDINVKVIDQHLTITNKPLIASGGVNEDYVIFDFDSTWDGFGKTAVFYKEDNRTITYDSIIDQNNKALVPHEVTATAGKFYFGVVGVKGDVLLTSQLLWYDTVEGAYEKESGGATPDIYQQMIELAEQLIEAVDDIIDDSAESENSTWSSAKISAELENSFSFVREIETNTETSLLFALTGSDEALNFDDEMKIYILGTTSWEDGMFLSLDINSSSATWYIRSVPITQYTRLGVINTCITIKKIANGYISVEINDYFGNSRLFEITNITSIGVTIGNSSIAKFQDGTKATIFSR